MTPSSINSKKSRLSRHLFVDGWSCTEQKLLDTLRIAIVGAGGLGSTVAIMICNSSSSGSVRCLFDDDLVDVTNLHRQIAFTESDLGRPKADCLRDACVSRNPSIDVSSSVLRISRSNACALLAEYDVIFDCTDNLESRIVLSDAWVQLGRRQVLISASCVGWSGQCVTFTPSSSCCVRCLYSGITDADSCQHTGQCAVQGVMGPVVGLVANLQVLQLFSYIQNICGKSYAPVCPTVRLLDLSKGGMWNYEYELVPSCTSCTKSPAEIPKIEQKINYTVPEISGDELLSLLLASPTPILLDVREQNHFRISRLRGSKNFPSSQFLRDDVDFKSLNSILDNHPTVSIIVVCRRGINSAKFVAHVSPKFPARKFFSLSGGLLGLSVPSFL